MTLQDDSLGSRPSDMANTPKWNIRLRHEWLSTPLKKKRIKRGQKARIGLLDAENRKKKAAAGKTEAQS